MSTAPDAASDAAARTARLTVLAGPTAVGKGTVTANPTQPKRGKGVTFTSAGFRSGESVAMRIDGGAVVRVTANAAGTATYKIGATRTVGKHTVSAQGYGSGRVATGTFTVRR